jgi:hypothetical protein
MKNTSATEINKATAWTLIGKKTIYAYNEETEQSYRILNKLDLRDAIKSEHVLYVNNN